MIYVYAITTALEEPPALVGMDGARLAVLRAGGVSAVYSDLPEAEVKPTPEALWCHDQVVECLMAQGSVLPARFGTQFPDLESLAGVLAREGASWAARLERVNGCVELAVRVNLQGSEPRGGAEDGRAYLERRLAARRRHEDALRIALRPLSELAVASVVNPAPDEETVRAAYLVPAQGVEGFARQVRRAQAEHQELSLSCTGPWAPYSFAEGPLP